MTTRPTYDFFTQTCLAIERVDFVLTAPMEVVRSYVRPPLAIALGSPKEIVDLVAAVAVGETICYQMDLFQAERVRHELREIGLTAEVVTAADYWDLPTRFQTILYPAPSGGERALKIDLIEQTPLPWVELVETRVLRKELETLLNSK